MSLYTNTALSHWPDRHLAKRVVDLLRLQWSETNLESKMFATATVCVDF